jgi:death on curing protein
LAILSATYAYHLSQAHAFIDGNKRIAAVVSELFLELNGAKLNATNEQIIELFLDLASSLSTREEVERKFTEWITMETENNG